MIDDPDLNLAMHEASAPLVSEARRLCGRLPSVNSDEFLHGELVVRQAVLVVVGISRIHFGDPVRHLLREVSSDIHGGNREFWRRTAANHVTHEQLEKRRAVPRKPVRCTTPGCHELRLCPIHEGGAAA